MRLALIDVQLVGDELAIRWNDETESYFKLEFLRRACPCAACGGEPDVMGRIERPSVSYVGSSFRLIGWQLVGGYALQLRWGDGHDSGLYSFRYLQRLAT